MERHYSRETLAWLAQAQGQEAEFESVARHILRCPRCRAIAADCAVALARGERHLAASAPGSTLFAMLRDDARASVELLKAKSWCADLWDLSPEEQARRILSTAALQQPAIFETILAEARVKGRSDPFLGEALVRTAITVANALPASGYMRAVTNDLRARALTVSANCRRLAADFSGARAALDEARQCLEEGTREPSLAAELLSIEASLSSDLGRFEEAVAHARHATGICLSLEDWSGVAHNSVLEASCLLKASRLDEAVECARAALGRIPPMDLRLRVLALLAVVDGTTAAGRPVEAISSLLEAEHLCQQLGESMQLNLLHSLALLLDALGCARESEKLFRYTIRGYFDQEHYKKAFVSLLALFESYCRRGALAKAAVLCEEAIAATSQAGEGCNDQIRRVWEELLAAVRVRQLSASELVQARQFLVRHWSAPARRAFTLGDTLAALPRPSPPAAPPPPPQIPPVHPSEPASLRAAREDFDRQLVAVALERAHGNLSEACRQLGISRNTLKARMRQYGLTAGTAEGGEISLDQDSPLE